MTRALPLVLAFSLAGVAGCNERKSEVPPAPKAVEADNTGRNQRDREEATVTPTDQKENETDLRITADIRQALVDDGALSFDAKNVKVVTSGGAVTLRGPVASELERASIEAKAKSVAGVSRVDNQLEIKSSN